MAGVKVILVIVVSGLLASASALSSTAASVRTGEPRIVYRTVRLANPQRPPELYSVLPSGQGRRLLVRGGEQPAWSPNRRRIAFAGGGILRRKGIWVMNADGSGQRRLTSRAGDGDPTWSPDGRRIAFRRNEQTSFDLWVVPVAGGRARSLLRTPRANERAPDWSPDGRRIAFDSSRSGEIQVWVMTLASGVARRLTGGRASFSPDWSPDGRRIAFMTRGRIAVVGADGRRLRTLPSGMPMSADDPAWSPDGRRIAFQRGGQVLSMCAGGGDLRYVTRAAWGTNGEPDW
jgi:dipeptidyl aminopeptidase/acylaminoacyl peptidase